MVEIKLFKFWNTQLLESERITVLWLRLNFTFIDQSNGVTWRIYDFWLHFEETKNILYFWESSSVYKARTDWNVL